MKNQVVSIDKVLKYVTTEEVVYQEFEGLVEASNDSEAENRDQLKEYLSKTSTIETYSKGHWFIKDDFEELNNWSKEHDVLFLLQPIGQNPEPAITKVVEIEGEKYSAPQLDDSLIMVGCMRSTAQREWVMTQGKYNIRINTGENREGAVIPDGMFFNIKHLLLYMEDRLYASEYFDVTLDKPLEYAGLDRLKELKYPFNVARFPLDTYDFRVDRSYMKRMYMLYGMEVVPNPFPGRKKIDMTRLLSDFIIDSEPTGKPFVMKMSDLVKYMV